MFASAGQRAERSAGAADVLSPAPAAIARLVIAALAAPVQPQSHADVFARSLVDAINSRDLGRRVALLHPAARACVTPQTQSYFDWIFTRQTRHTVPANYRVSSGEVNATDQLPTALLPADNLATYPIRPSHRVQIDFQTGPSSGTTLIVMAAAAGENAWARSCRARRLKAWRGSRNRKPREWINRNGRKRP